MPSRQLVTASVVAFLGVIQASFGEDIPREGIRIKYGDFPYYDDGGVGADSRTRARLGDLSVYVVRIFPAKHAAPYMSALKAADIFPGQDLRPQVVTDFPHELILVPTEDGMENGMFEQRAAGVKVRETLAKGGEQDILVLAAKKPRFFNVPAPVGTYYLDYNLVFINGNVGRYVHPNYVGDVKTARWGPPRVEVNDGQFTDVMFQPTDNIAFYEYNGFLHMADKNRPKSVDYSQSTAILDFMRYLKRSGAWDQ